MEGVHQRTCTARIAQDSDRATCNQTRVNVSERLHAAFDREQDNWCQDACVDCTRVIVASAGGKEASRQRDKIWIEPARCQ